MEKETCCLEVLPWYIKFVGQDFSKMKSTYWESNKNKAGKYPKDLKVPKTLRNENESLPACSPQPMKKFTAWVYWFFCLFWPINPYDLDHMV